MAFAGIGLFFAGYLLGSKRSTSNSNHRNSSNSGDKGDGGGAFVLLVNMKFVSIIHRDKFLTLIEPVCKDVRANEGPDRGSSRTTLSYQVAISDKDPLLVVVMERYNDKDNGYLTVHRSGKEFLKFREQLKGMQSDGHVEIMGESYLETGLGFV